MPRQVEEFIAALKKKGHSESSAIAIGKSRGLISQQGKHLGWKGRPQMQHAPKPKKK